MNIKYDIHTDYKDLKSQLLSQIDQFEFEGQKIGNGNRNSIKGFDLAGHSISIKAFKKPHLINRIVYRYFRKSKAERSYLHALKLLENEILTPKPIGFLVQNEAIGIGKSYYICQYLNFDLMYSDLVENQNLPAYDSILRAFTGFTYDLHEKGIFFKDHSAGNTLIVKNQDSFEFYLVDLNRMDFKPLDFDNRMKNFSRLTPHKDMVRIMSNEYAQLSGIPFQDVFKKMWFYTNQFQERFFKKRAFKKKYLGKKY